MYVSVMTSKHPVAFCVNGPTSFELCSVLRAGSGWLPGGHQGAGLGGSDQQGPHRVISRRGGVSSG